METFDNPFQLLGKRVFVTGASSGIGRSIAIECSKMGAQVILSARDRERLEETRSLMCDSEQHQIICADLSDVHAMDDLVMSIEEPLDGLVQCAGITIIKPFKYITEEDIDRITHINYKAPVLLSQKLLSKRKVKKGGSVVFISSVSGVYVSAPASGLYSGSKAALSGIMKGMAIDLASRNIRVNCVNPGMIETQFFSDKMIDDVLLEQDKKRYPLGRFGKPEDVAYAVIYLLSDASSWMTGTNIKIDGGLTLL